MYPISYHTWWRHQMETFSASLALCAGNSPVPVNSPHKGQWSGALVFSLICVWIHGWVNKGEAGDLICHRGHYDINVMSSILFNRRRPNSQWSNHTCTLSYSKNTMPADGQVTKGARASANMVVMPKTRIFRLQHQEGYNCNAIKHIFLNDILKLFCKIIKQETSPYMDQYWLRSLTYIYMYRWVNARKT